MTPAIAPDLPVETAEALRATSNENLPHAIAAMRKKGWSLRTLGDALGLSHETVRTLQSEGDAERSPFVAPDKPEVERIQRAPREVKPEIPVEVAARMRELVPVASLRKGTTPAGSPIIEASDEYTNLLVEQHARGVSRASMEEATGQNWNALRRRLVQGGAMTRPPSFDKKYARASTAAVPAEAKAAAKAPAKGSKKSKKESVPA